MRAASNQYAKTRSCFFNGLDVYAATAAAAAAAAVLCSKVVLSGASNFKSGFKMSEEADQ